jgi:hypothetical protein
MNCRRCAIAFAPACVCCSSDQSRDSIVVDRPSLRRLLQPFWKLLFESRLVPEQIGYEDDVRLPDWGFGITNIVARPTAGIDSLEKREYIEGRVRLRRKVRRYRPAIVALIGVTVFRAMFPERNGIGHAWPAG